MKAENFWEWDFMENAGRSIANVTDDGIEINIISEIGGDYWGMSNVTKDSFLEALTGNEDKPVVVNISSLGGDVDTALYINTLLSKHKDVTVFYSGIVASAATWLGSNGKRIADPNTIFMLHESGSIAGGTKQDMTAAAKMLTIVDNSIFGIYSAMTGKPVSYFQEQIDNNGGEWWLNANEALEIGLIHEIKAFDGAITDVQPMPEKTAEKFGITNSLYIMQNQDQTTTTLKKILNFIQGIENGGGDEGEEKTQTVAPVTNMTEDEKTELNNVIAELRARVDELQDLIARYETESAQREEEAETMKAENKKLADKITALSMKPTEQPAAATNKNISPKMAELLAKSKIQNIKVK
mgnify:CR=1 FL=1